VGFGGRVDAEPAHADVVPVALQLLVLAVAARDAPLVEVPGDPAALLAVAGVEAEILRAAGALLDGGVGAAQPVAGAAVDALAVERIAGLQGVAAVLGRLLRAVAVAVELAGLAGVGVAGLPHARVAGGLARAALADEAARVAAAAAAGLIEGAAADAGVVHAGLAARAGR